MSKDLLVTIGGVLALGAVLFGAGLFVAGTALQDSPAVPVESSKPEDTHGSVDDGHGKTDGHGKVDEKDKKKETEKGHGNAHGSGHGGAKDAHGTHGEESEEAIATGPRKLEDEDLEYLKVLERKFNDNFTRGIYDDARSMALKAQNMVPDSLHWQRRLADSTFMSDELGTQQRYQRAYEIYSGMIATEPTPRESEWPRYRSVLCLKNMNRWEEAAQVADAYLKLYKSTPRAMEIGLIQAQCQFALGDRPAAKKNVEKLLALDLPSELRAAAMLELAHIERETPPSQVELRAEVINVAELDARKPSVDEAPMSEPKAELSALVPKAQWDSIRNAAKTGNLLEAQRLISPWLDSTGPMNATQRAKIALDYASLLRELAHAAQQQ